LDCGDLSPLFLHRTPRESGGELKRSRGQLVTQPRSGKFARPAAIRGAD